MTCQRLQDLYADSLLTNESKLYLCVMSRTDQENVQADLFKLCDWSKKWLLTFNVAKCKAVVFGNQKYDFTYQMINTDGETKIFLVNLEKKIWEYSFKVI